MTKTSIPLESWRPNQNVILLSRHPATLRVIRNQPDSTPGVITTISVEKDTRYTLEVDITGNCPIKFYLADKNRKPLPVDYSNLQDKNYNKKVISFVAQRTERVLVGFLLRHLKPSHNTPDESYFDIHSASIQEVQRKSGTVASLATMPSRMTSLPATLASIIDQVDHVFVHLNEFKEVPDFLKRPEVTITRSQDVGNLRDTGKFLGLRDVSDSTLFFTIDDDIIYPSNYVEKMTAALDHYDRRVAVGVHGTIFPNKPRGFFDRIAIHFKRELAVDIPVSCLGTGTTAFQVGTLRPKISDFRTHGMADLYFAEIAKNNDVPLITIARRSDWLYDALEPAEIKNTLYQETRTNNTSHSRVLSESEPWGFESIHRTIEGVKLELGRDPLSLEARALLNYGLWIESSCSGVMGDIPLTPSTISVATALKLPNFLQRAIFKGEDSVRPA
ncbi:hypothetical protein LVO79_20680 (plasmid) [Roseivivax marinus]|uniref:hypothetical protein n=1 Tax=Roseivivax marinus TaxID=1379903 RepID=UPI001F05021E|nr:hypothetical protein [Roseivivax marinus]UMA67226.1 hypothetical protein LVO79_20680 [Roseivivax marinus]